MLETPTSLSNFYSFYTSSYDSISMPSSPPDLIRPTARVATTQLVIALFLGLFAFLSFSILRVRWPEFYVARLSRRKGLPPLPTKSLFGWIPVLYKISEAEVLEHAGLDAVVFLGFFKMSIKLLTVCTFFGFAVISPIRYRYTGNYDGDNDDYDDDKGFGVMSHKTDPPIDIPERDYQQFLWMYVVFTYVFTAVSAYFLLQQTKAVVKVRQSYLGKQNSVTDRTIRLSGIPPELRDEEGLKKHIESLNIGKVSSVVICREWKPLNKLFNQRKFVIKHLEKYYTSYLETTPLNTSPNISPRVGDSFRLNGTTNPDVENQSHRYTDEYSDEEDQDANSNMYRDQNTSPTSTDILSTLGQLTINEDAKRPLMKTGVWGLCGEMVDAIDYYSEQLLIIDEEIKKARKRHYPATPTAFITMDSVATAQMVAQAVLDPHVHYLITRLAPAPHDIIWENVCLSRKERVIKLYYITLIIGVLSVILVFPVTYLATLLNTKTISKFWPGLGDFLDNNKWAETLVTGLLPTYLFTLLNFAIPFLYVQLSSRQGHISHGEEELSAVSKNFFYIFVNLFLVFTMAGTASNYWGFLSDTTKIAYQLAKSLKDLSLFYVDLIILQGLGMFPFKLLLVGSLIRFPYFKVTSKTPRDFKNLYRPPIFNFGLQLPQPMLILVITIIYSVMSTKILASGLIYFVIGYYVYKYQLLFACTHPPHSTGKVWPLVFRRITMGLFIFQLFMVGSLALQHAYILATCLSPLPLITLAFLWNFQRNYIPLSFFIALRVIENPPRNSNLDTNRYLDNLENNIEANDESTLVPRSKTLDERRELNQTYEYPYLIQALDGPWIAVDGDYVVTATDNGAVRKRVSFYEWE